MTSIASKTCMYAYIHTCPDAEQPGGIYIYIEKMGINAHRLAAGANAAEVFLANRLVQPNEPHVQEKHTHILYILILKTKDDDQRRNLPPKRTSHQKSGTF